MVTGFKKDGKFHPISKSKGVSKENRVRYANDQGSAQIVNEGVKAFARKIKQKHQQMQANQKEEFNRELQVRRKFEGKLIIAFKLGRAQGINNSRSMEKFIRQQIRDLPDDRQTNKFVVRVLKDFLEREKELEKQKKGKGEDEQKALQTEFDNSLKESKALFESLQADQDKEFAQQQEKFNKEQQNKIDKLENEAKKKQDEAREAEEKARKTQQDPNASQEQKQKAEQQANQSEKQSDQAEEKQQDFNQDVLDELKKEEQKLDKQSFDVGFPEGII